MESAQHEALRDKLSDILSVVHLAEKLKSELRHSWLSDGRRESVAEHTWRLSLLAMLVEPLLGEKLDTARYMKMIVVHDLAEAIARDIPAFDTLNNADVRADKQAAEEAAMRQIVGMLGDELGGEVYELWLEFESKETPEARIANALDKLEAQIQHNEADLSTWLPIEREMSFMMGKHADFHPVLRTLKELIEEEAVRKFAAEGEGEEADGSDARG